METFQKIVLFSAIIILILALVVMGITLSSAGTTQWPPVVPECPDWWEASGTGSEKICRNIKNLGSCAPKDGTVQIMNFNTPTFSGSNGNCAKYTWAQKCNVAWDGITYGVANPCSTTTN
jgi:hypothetical protein